MEFRQVQLNGNEGSFKKRNLNGLKNGCFLTAYNCRRQVFRASQSGTIR